MNWKDLGEKLAAMGLPVLGGALGGPAGAAVGELVSKAIFRGDAAYAPKAVDEALATNPDLIAKLRELESNERVKLTELANAQAANELADETHRIEVINETMREEGKSEHWPQWSWRPFIGFTFGLAFLVVSALCCYIAWGAVVVKDMAAINMIPQLVGAFATLFAIPGAVLGVASWWRGKSKVSA